MEKYPKLNRSEMKKIKGGVNMYDCTYYFSSPYPPTTGHVGGANLAAAQATANANCAHGSGFFNPDVCEYVVCASPNS